MVSTFCRFYSPDLNPIERVWKLTRQLCLHNVYFAKLDQVCATLLSNSLTDGASGAVRSKNCAQSRKERTHLLLSYRHWDIHKESPRESNSLTLSIIRAIIR